MKIKFLRNYPKNGKVQFVYTVEGSAAELEAYKKAQGEWYREGAVGTPEAGKALWFTQKYVGDTGKLVVTKENKIYADTSEFAKAESLAKQYGGNLGQELAKIAAGKLLGGDQTVETPVETPAVTAKPE